VWSAADGFDPKQGETGLKQAYTGALGIDNKRVLGVADAFTGCVESGFKKARPDSGLL
jgi:hypothetical protein